MGWKTINGRRYFYEWVEVNGEYLQKCRGRGEEAKLAALKVAQKRADASGERAIVCRWEIQDRNTDYVVSELRAKIHSEVTRTLVMNGYHRHRGQWRKMQRATRMQAPQIEDSNFIASEEALKLENEVRRLSLEVLRRGSVDPPTEDGKVDEVIKDVFAKVEAMRKELNHENATAIEKLLVEQVITAWVQWFVAGWQVESIPCEDGNLRKGQYLERRYLRCQTRLSRAVDQLARIRCVRRPFLNNGRS